MNKKIQSLFYLSALIIMFIACSKTAMNQAPAVDTELVNTAHLDYLYTPLTFPAGSKSAGVYIYADAPDYHRVEASGEGFSCVDDVSRAALVYLRSTRFSTDTAIQAKAMNLIRFILGMQSDNGYFYNFLFSSGLINTGGSTSLNIPNWWSWRALQTLIEGEPFIKNLNPPLFAQMDAAIIKLIAQIKLDLVNIPQTTKIVNGITVPEWLPAGSATDQSALLIIGLIPWCQSTNDAVLRDYIKKLADGIALMQAGDSSHYPYGCFLSWENTWHAYGNIQAYALLKAGLFLNDPQYTSKALVEIDNFYPWLIKNGYKSSLLLAKSGNVFQTLTDNKYDQIAYGIEPMVFAAIEAYKETGNDTYADLAGHLAAWLLGANDLGISMYDTATGRCYDGLSAGGVNYNSGAESTIEALLTLQNAENYPAVITALDKYKK
ncbi:MAG: hypothetical protein H0W62_10895 [Chitinophagales bacterium]|nr:hypothetical protein [Chitinophagales bacterium]